MNCQQDKLRQTSTQSQNLGFNKRKLVDKRNIVPSTLPTNTWISWASTVDFMNGKPVDMTII